MDIENIRKRFKTNLTSAILIALFVVSVIIIGLTIGAEFSKPFKDGLKDAFGHHWVGKGIIAAIAFLLITFLLAFMPLPNSKKDDAKFKKLALLSAITVIIGTVVIIVFFVWLFFAH